MEEKIKELSLLLLYLSGWEEDVKDEPGKKLYKSWSGYLFDILNSLEEEKMIKQTYKSRALQVLPKGLKRAQELKQKYI